MGRKALISFILTIVAFFLWEPHGAAIKITDKFSIGGIMAGAYQYQDVSDVTDFESTGRGALAFQPEISLTPTDNNEIFAKFGFGAGNALNDGTSPFHISPWAANLEDDVKDINGRHRDYLLTAWYKHTFALGTNHLLGIAGGIIDATDYLDENAYAGDEYTQFMNGALVHKVHDFFPSYDLGAAAEWNMGAVSVKGTVMNVGTGSDDTYNYYGLQFGYLLNTALGEGNYRIIADRTSRDFEDSQGRKDQAMGALAFSFDQQFGDILGAWIRFGRQDDDAVIDYRDLYSGGIDISGKLWKRENDNIGIGYAHLRDGNSGIDNTQVAEAYMRIALNEVFALTLDVQWMKDDLVNGDDVKGFIYSVRMAAEF
jgi:Carbohydrate-selective porin, OprB family